MRGVSDTSLDSSALHVAAAARFAHASYARSAVMWRRRGVRRAGGHMRRDVERCGYHGKKGPCSTWQHSTRDLTLNCSINTFSCSTASH